MILTKKFRSFNVVVEFSDLEVLGVLNFKPKNRKYLIIN